MKKARVLIFCLTLTSLLAACGDRNSGFSPAENAVTANPEDTIALRARDYELPPATPAPDGPTASYDTGDSSGGRTLTLDTLEASLERAAAETEPYLEDALVENALEDGTSTTIADETSEGDAAEATGGDLNVVTDPTETPTDTVVDPATGGEVKVEGTVEEMELGEDVEPDAVELDIVEMSTAEPGTDEAAGEPSEEAVEDEVIEEAPAVVADPETEADSETVPTTQGLAETGGAAEGTAEGSSVPETTAETGPEEIGPEETGPAETTPLLAQAASFDWQQLGETTYANCVACHQQNGQGIVGAFPPLAGHINELYNAPGGRKYIINVVLYGLQGEIDVLGQSYNGLMAAWPQLNDEEVAATLNHELTSWGNDALLEDFSPILPEEVAAERGNALSSAQVLELRPALP